VLKIFMGKNQDKRGRGQTIFFCLGQLKTWSRPCMVARICTLKCTVRAVKVR